MPTEDQESGMRDSVSKLRGLLEGQTGTPELAGERSEFTMLETLLPQDDERKSRYYLSLGERLRDVREKGWDAILQGRAQPEAPRAYPPVPQGLEVQSRLLGWARKRLQTLDSIATTPEGPGRDRICQQLSEYIVDLERRITKEEYQQMAVNHYVSSIDDLLSELQVIPADDRAGVVKGIDGFDAAFALLQGQTQRVEDSLQALASVHAIRATVAAPPNKFNGNEAERKKTALQHLEELDASLKKRSDPNLQDRLARLKELLSADELYKNAGTIEHPASAIRYVLEQELNEGVRSPLHKLTVPKSVDEPLELKQVTDKNQPQAQITPLALRLGLHIGQNRYLAEAIRSRIKPMMTETDVKRIGELERRREQMLPRFFTASETVLRRRNALHNLLVQGEHLGVPLDIPTRDVELLKKTREFINTHIQYRERLRALAIKARPQFERQDDAMSEETDRMFMQTLVDIAQASMAETGQPTFVLKESHEQTLDFERVMILLGISSHRVPINRAFSDPEIGDLQKMRNYLQSSDSKATELRNKLLETMRALRALKKERALDAEPQEQQQKHFEQLLDILQQLKGQSGASLEPKDFGDVMAILEMLDLGQFPQFYVPLPDEDVRELGKARRENLGTLRNYLEEWRKLTSSSSWDLKSLTQHILTMRVFGMEGVATVDMPGKFEDSLKQAEKPAWYVRPFFNAQQWMPSGLASRTTNDRLGYDASKARLEGMTLLGMRLLQHPTCYDVLGGALIVPPEELVDEQRAEKWRETFIENLRKMDEQQRKAALQENFSDESIKRSVIAIDGQYRGRINASSRLLENTWLLQDKLASGEGGAWTPELVGKSSPPEKPSWWQEPIAGNLDTWVALVTENMKRCPDDDPERERKMRGARWVFDELKRLSVSQMQAFDKDKREYIEALNRNFKGHISMSMLYTRDGDQQLVDLELAAIIAGEVFLWAVLGGVMRGRGVTRVIPGGAKIGAVVRRIPYAGSVSGFFYDTFNGPFATADWVIDKTGKLVRKGVNVARGVPRTPETRLRAPESQARFTRAKEVLADLGYTDELTDAQKIAILDAHAVPSSLPEGQTGLWGSRFTVDDLAKKAEILREQFPHSAHWKALMRKGVCGDDLSKLIRSLSDTALEELAGLKIPPRAPGTRIGSAAETAKSQKALQSLLSDREFLEMLKSGRQGVKTAEDAELFLEAARRAGQLDLDPRTLSMIQQSGRARKMLAGAISTGEVGEVSRVLRAANVARNTRIGLNVVGAVGDVFGLYMAYCDWQANIDRINQTSNPALIELYQQANYLYAAEAGASAVGIVVGGYAMISAYAAGEGVLGALSATGGTIMLPIAVAVIGGGLYYRELEAASEGWLKEEADWKKHTEGDLMGEFLQNSQPGQVGSGFFDARVAAHATNAEAIYNWVMMDQKEFDRWNEDGYKLIEDAQKVKRYRLVHSLIPKLTSLPKQGDESDDHYQKRLKSYIDDQLKYLLQTSQRALDIPFVSWFEKAKMHAEMMAYGRALRAAGMEGVLRWKVPGGNDKEQSYDMALYGAEGFDLTRCPAGLMDAFRNQLYFAGIVGQLNAIRSLYKGDVNYLLHRSIQEQLLLEVRPYLAKIEGEIMRQDYEGILSWDDKGKAAARYVSSVRLRQYLQREADRMIEQKTITVQDFTSAAGRIRAVLTWPDLIESPDGSVVKLTGDERDRARQYPALALQWHSQAFKGSKDLPNLEYYRAFPRKAAQETDLHYIVDHLFIGQKHFKGNRPLIIRPSPQASPTVSNFRAQVRPALEADPKERELSVWVRNLENLHEVAYRNASLDPQGLYYYSFTYHRPQEAPREGMNRPDFIPVLHRLAPDGSDTPLCRVYSDFFSSRDIEDGTRDIALRTLLNYCSQGYSGPAQVRSFLSFFPYEVRNGVNYQEVLIKELTPILATLGLKDAETHILFFRELIKQLERCGGCTERASKEIPNWFDGSKTNPLWERTPWVPAGTYRGPSGRTKWPKAISF